MCKGNHEPSGRGWSLPATVIATCLGLSLGLFPETALASGAMDAQGFEPLPAARRAPPGLAEIPGEAPPLRRPPSVQELLDIVARQPGGREKLDRAQSGRREGLLPSPARAPGELEDGGRRPMPALGPPPSVDELLTTVRQQPGGEQKVEAALRLRRQRSGGSGPLSWLRSLNPFGVKTAWAAPGWTGEWSSRRRQECRDAISWTDIELNYIGDYCTGNPTAWAKFYGGSELHRSWAVLRPYSNPASWGSFGHRIEKPLAVIHFNARQWGYYVIAVVHCGTATYQTELRHYQGGSSYPLQQAWGGGGIASYACSTDVALVPLAEGPHYFYWVVSSATRFVPQIFIRKVA